MHLYCSYSFRHFCLWMTIKFEIISRILLKWKLLYTINFYTPSKVYVNLRSYNYVFVDHQKCTVAWNKSILITFHHALINVYNVTTPPPPPREKYGIIFGIIKCILVAPPPKKQKQNKNKNKNPLYFEVTIWDWADCLVSYIWFLLNPIYNFV